MLRVKVDNEIFIGSIRVHTYAGLPEDGIYIQVAAGYFLHLPDLFGAGILLQFVGLDGAAFVMMSDLHAVA